uniref:Ladybird homeobox 2 n=1 Tax=Panthera tigris altaica TaxID=74533 RepID=A0A8C9K432_PANTA
MNSGPEPRTPRTLFSIADILGPRLIPRGPSTSQLPESSPGPTSPLCALEELTSKTFRGFDWHAPEPSEGIAQVPVSLKKRKTRVRITFITQGCPGLLGLANAQVVTWFQNRRAKLKRDVEEMRADVASLRTLSPEVQCRLSLPDGTPRPVPGRPDSGPHLSEEEIKVD